MKNGFKKQRGVAILLVISSIVVLATLATEFAYDTSVSYHLALNERNRLQAHYLARSAYNFMLLELKFDRVFRNIVQSQNLGQYLGGNAQLPLCQQFPMSTGLIRMVFTGGGLPGVGGEGGGEGEAPAGEAVAPENEGAGDEAIEKMQKGASISQEQNAEEFLAFEGDFDGECVDEGTKINLNGFAGLSVTPANEGELSPLDQYKQFLFRFLSSPRFELLFKEADVRVTDVTNNIGDWVDADTEMNGLGGRMGGAERSIYDRLGVPYSVANGKLLTLLEVYMIDGVVDDWFSPLMDYFTVYGDGRINVCTASQDVLESVIKRYVESTPGLPPLRLEDAEEMGKLTKAVTDVCAAGATGNELKQQLSSALNSAIGAVSSSAPARPTQPQQTPQAGTQGQGQPDTGFGAYVATEPRFFSLKLTGQVGDMSVRLKTVIDVKETDPKKWKLLYWRVY